MKRCRKCKQYVIEIAVGDWKIKSCQCMMLVANTKTRRAHNEAYSDTPSYLAEIVRDMKNFILTKRVELEKQFAFKFAGDKEGEWKKV